MTNISNCKKITFNFIMILCGIVAFCLFVYLWLIPHLVSDKKLINSVEQAAYNYFGVNLSIDSPKLKTGLNTSITFRIAGLKLDKGNSKLLEIKDLNTTLLYRDILLKRIIIKRFSVEGFYADINKLMALAPKQDKCKKPQKCDWDIDIYDALLYAKNVEVLYVIDKNTNLKIISKGFGTNNAKKKNRRVGFNVLFDLTKNGESYKVFLRDDNKVIIDNKTLYINDLPVVVNNSKLYINLKANRKIKYWLTITGRNFDIQNLVKLIDSNLIIPDGKELLALAANNIKGNFDFNIDISKKKGIDGKAKLNTCTMNITSLNNLPVTLEKGDISFNDKNIKLNNFEGYYFNNKISNKIKFAGTIDDYMKTMQINLQGDTFLTDEFMRKCASKLIGCPISLVGDAGTRVIIKSKNNKFDILAYSRLLPDEDILVDGMSLTPKKYERIIKADMHFEDMLLKINGIDYYIGSLKEGAKDFKRKSVMVLSGNVDCATLKIRDMGINIPDPLPSEFFNLFVGPKFFRKGTVQGYIHVDNRGEYPILVSKMKAHGIRVPSQRIKITDAQITTDNNCIHINSFGKFKRSDYKFVGNIKNNLTLPIIVNNVNLTVDDMDLEKLLMSFNQQNTSAVASQPKAETVDDDADDDAFVFNTGLIIVNDCNLNLIKGHFQDIKIGNLHALLTLDKNGVLKVTSNKFDFAEGISTLKLNCDLMNHKYYVRLGVKDVNSDLIASSLLALKKEISGKAKGLIELNTDDSLKLNGKILFNIENGTIGKVGFLEYVLKFASLFRNPMAMISPSTLIDLVNIPEGEFDTIKGELYIKNNNVELIKIKSKAPQLSSFIVGCFNLDSRDAILRIYTKMSNKHKGIYGVMRNISLNALANRIPLGNVNETNYYSAELKQLPELDAPEKDCQIFLTKVDGDVENFNFISSLKRIK